MAFDLPSASDFQAAPRMRRALTSFFGVLMTPYMSRRKMAAIALWLGRKGWADESSPTLIIPAWSFVSSHADVRFSDS